MSSTPFLAEAHVMESDDAVIARALNQEEISRNKPVACVEAQAYDANEHYYQDPYQSYPNQYGPYERRVIYQNEIDEELNGMLLFCWCFWLWFFIIIIIAGICYSYYTPQPQDPKGPPPQ